MQQPNLICSELTFYDCRCVWSFLSATPTNQKCRITVIGQGHLRNGRDVAHGLLVGRNSGGSAFANEGASKLTPALVK